MDHYFSFCLLYRLLIYAVLNAMLENNEAADLFFETATSEDSDHVIGWTLYGMNKIIFN